MARREPPTVPYRSARVPGQAPSVPVARPHAAAPSREAVAAAAQPMTHSATSVAALPEVSFLTRWAVAAAVFLAISKFHGYISVLAVIRAPMLLSVTALILLFLDRGPWRPGDLTRHWIPKATGLLALIALGSIPFGIYQGKSLDTFNEVLSRTLLIALMVWAVARTEKGALFITRTLTLSIIVAAMLAFILGREDNTGRLAGGYSYDPNDIALMGVTGIPLVIWWALDKRNKYRFLILAALPLLFQVVIKSQSRGGFLGLLAMTAGFLLIGLGPVDKRVKKAGIVVGLLIVMTIPFFPTSYLTQMKTITSDDDYNQTSISGRKEVWKRGFGYALERPLFGVGLGNFASAEGRSDVSTERAEQNKGFKWSTAHNSYILVLAELGFIGGSCFAILIFGSIIALFRHHRAGSRKDLLPPFFALAMIGFAASAFFLSWAYYDMTWALIATAGAILVRREGTTPAAVGAPVLPVSGRRLRA